MLSFGVLCVILCLAILIEHRLVTDGQMDGQTDKGLYRASIASRGKRKNLSYLSYVAKFSFSNGVVNGRGKY